MTITFTTLTPEDIDRELRELEQSLKVPLEQARLLEEAGVLDADQYDVMRRIHELEWLRDAE